MRKKMKLGFVIGFVAISQLSCSLLTAEFVSKEDNPPSPTAIPPTYTPVLIGPLGSLPSPDGNYFALVRDEGRLVVMDSQGQETEIASSNEITRLTWFPDSQHLIYEDRVKAAPERAGYKYRLFIVSASSGEIYQIENGLAPSISPDGNRIAYLRGWGSGDACIASLRLVIIELDAEKYPLSETTQDEIAGIPFSEETHSFTPNLDQDKEFPGSWQDETTLEVAMSWACVGPGNGIYEIDVVFKEAKMIAELPSPFSEEEWVDRVGVLPAVPNDERQGYFSYPRRGGDAGLASVYPGRTITITWEEAPIGATRYDIFFAFFEEDPILIGTDEDASDGVQVEWTVPELIGGTLVGIAYYGDGRIVYSGWSHDIYSGKLPPEGVCTLSSGFPRAPWLYPGRRTNPELGPTPGETEYATLFPEEYALVIAKTEDGWYLLDTPPAEVGPSGEPATGIWWLSEVQDFDLIGPCDDLPVVED